METEKFLVAGGNPTILVWGCPPDSQTAISQQHLESGDAEQVGFIDIKHGITYLTMMGNELCVNATLALAAKSGGSGEFFTRGLDTFVVYSNTDWTTVKVRLPFKREGKTILFDGIGYSCYIDEVSVTKEEIIDLAKQYNLPAFGIIICKGNSITPLVYVVDTGSFVHESACGSGSVAASIILGLEDIIQPSGETIKIKSNDNWFTVSAHVKAIAQYASDNGENPNHLLKYGLHKTT